MPSATGGSPGRAVRAVAVAERAAGAERAATPERVLLASMRFDPHFGGVENSLRELARALSERGHQVRIVASTSAPPGAARPARRSWAYGADVVRFPYLPGPLVGVSVLAAAITLAAARHTFRPTNQSLAKFAPKRKPNHCPWLPMRAKGGRHE